MYCATCGKDHVVTEPCPYPTVVYPPQGLEIKPCFTCPVCKGSQIVPAGFYTKIGETWTPGMATESCRSCKNGIVWKE